MAEGSSHSQPGPYFYQMGGKTYASLPTKMLQGIQQCPHYEQMLKDCAAEGVQIPKNILAQDPRAQILTPQQYLKNVEGGNDASHVQPQPAEGNGSESWASRPDKVCNDGISQFPAAAQAGYTGTSEQKVSEIAIQTESCDTIYVTKDTLVVYTIAVVQNTQTLQFEQMQVALQTVQNHASIEMPLRAEHLMTAHFNLAILTDNTASKTAANAPTTETGVTDPGPSTFASEEETICKSPHPNSHTNKRDKPPQLTGAVVPTCRGEPDPVRGIQVGYKSDNSWDFSDAGEQDCSQRHNITALVAYNSWRNRLNRGRSQSCGQGNNITVWGGNAPHPWSWQNQPYGHQTRSQQALWAHAYHKWQRRHDLP